MEEIEKKPRWIFALSAIFIIFAVALLIFYWIIPIKEINLSPNSKNYNFSLSPIDPSTIQFYENMRFPNKEISYSIDPLCTIQKKQEMKETFKQIEDFTILRFYESETPEILIICDDKNHLEKGIFIAGEGGPTNITKTKTMNVILNGKILLIKNTECPTPNVAIHELLHVLGFQHSSNKNNIMYNFSKCDQTIGAEIPELINNLYSISNIPDLEINTASVEMDGNYANINLNIANNGLAKANSAKLIIKTDQEIIKTIELNPLDIGYGSEIKITNLLISNPNSGNLIIEITYSPEEWDKKNNKIELEI